MIIVGLLLIWWSSLPLGVPGEWTWTRSPVAPDFWFSLLPATVWAMGMGAVLWAGSTRIETCSRGARTIWLLLLLLMSFGMLSGLRDAAPPEFRGAKVAWVLYYPGASGYFTEARRIKDTRVFLANYAQGLKTGDVLHQGTHPPGLIVGYRGLMWVCGQSPWLRKGLLATIPPDLHEAFQVIAGSTVGLPTQLTEQDRCVLWLAACLMQLCAAATVLPLYALIRLHASRTTAWHLAAFWPLVPVVTIFSPKSDTCFPFAGCLVLALWLSGLRRNSMLLCLAAGCVFWLGMTLSLAMLPVACLAGLLTLWYVWGCRTEEQLPNGTTRLLRGLVAGGGGFLALTCVTTWGTGCNLLEVWVWNYRNHAGFYAQYPRTYWKWLLVNPIEISVATGLPMALAAFSLPTAWKNRRTAAAGPFWMSLLTWSLLWLTGKNMGEAARLWIFLIPWVIWSAAIGWEARLEGGSVEGAVLRRRWMISWAYQWLGALALITRVAGFHIQG